MTEHIFADTAGINNRPRLTHLPSGKTLMSQPWMGQADWDRLCREFLEPYRELELRFENGTAAMTVTSFLDKSTVE